MVSGEGELTESSDKTVVPRSGSSVTALIVAKLEALCALVPYALVGLGMRLLMARVIFLSGQTMIEGPDIPVWAFGGVPNYSIVLPVGIKETAFQMFATQYAALPLPPTTAAYLYGYAEFALPICLVIGFATRFAAFGLLVLAGLMSFYVMPEAFWLTHSYWFVILLALVSLGPGAISIDALIRHLNRP